jgi:cardiolipin synthase
LNWIAAHIAVVLVVLLVFAVAVRLIQERRTPQSTLAWLLAFIAIPYVALPVYLLLGVRKNRSRSSQLAAVHPSHKGEPGPALRFQRLGGPAAISGNNLVLLDAPQSGYDALMRSIGAATQTIDATFYLVADDLAGRAFVEALADRARSGIKVRLLLDRIGSLHPPRAALETLRAAGGSVRFFSPLLHWPDRRHLNLRNHRKMLVADGARVFAGGMNVGNHYLSSAPSAESFADLSYLLEGPAAGFFSAIFESDWNSDDDPPDPAPCAGDAMVQFVASGPDVGGDVLHDGLVDAIHRANRRVWIATPYFIATQPMLAALEAASRTGVDVRIMVPAVSNQWTADLARGADLRRLQQLGCQILLHRKMLHAKAGVIDAMAWCGSANFDIRSMLLNFETALLVHDGRNAAAISQWFEKSAGDCQVGFPEAGFGRRLAEGILRLGAPVL